jgi:hypothetical protein
MMAHDSTVLIIDQPIDEAVGWVVDRISQSGLTVIRTFDLQIARNAHFGSECPYHGTGPCDCQMVVLLIYEENKRPVALMAHGYNHQTWFSVVDTPQQRADPEIGGIIRSLLIPPLTDAIMV